MVVVAGRGRGTSAQEGVWPTRGLHAVNAIPRTYQRWGPVEQVLVVRAGRVGRAVVATMASSTARGPTYCTALVLQAGWAHGASPGWSGHARLALVGQMKRPCQSRALLGGEGPVTLLSAGSLRVMGMGRLDGTMV